DGLGDVLLTLDHVVVIHDGAGNTDHVGFLKGVVTDPVLGYLTGDHHQGDGIHVGGGNAGDGIGGTGPRGDQHRPHLAGDAGIGIGGVDRGLLVAHQDMVHLVLPENGIVDMQRRPTGVAPDMLDTRVVQGTDQDVAAR